MVKHAGVEYALERAHAVRPERQGRAPSLPDSDDKETLVLVADFVVDRDR